MTIKIKKFKNTKIYIAGHNGMVGNALLRYFKKTGFKKIYFVTKKKLNLLNQNKVENFIKSKKPDVIIFEGWCVGARPQKNSNLKKSVNSLEKSNDPNLIWRKHVNDQLKTKYKKLFSYLDCLLYMKAKNFGLLQKWRLKQEKKLWIKSKNKKNLKLMSKGDIINFMQTYQRITQNMFKDVPKYASIIVRLNSNHQIKTINFRK